MESVMYRGFGIIESEFYDGGYNVVDRTGKVVEIRFLTVQQAKDYIDSGRANRVKPPMDRSWSSTDEYLRWSGGGDEYDYGPED